VARSTRKLVRPLFVARWKFLYDVLGVVVTQLTIAYIIVPFKLHSVAEAHHVYKSVYYFGHVLILGAFILLRNKGVVKALTVVADRIHADAEPKSRVVHIHEQ
jgi:hypothetical protein